MLEHGAGHPRKEFEDEREELASRFRTRYGSHHESGEARRSNVAPSFVGVFDTVAALGAKGTRLLVLRVGLGLSVTLAALLPAVIIGGLVASLSRVTFWPATGVAWGVLTTVGWSLLLFRLRRSVRKTIRDYPAKGDVRRHRAEWKGEHFSRLLSQFVPFARSANAIDETRADFDRLSWGYGAGINPDELIQGQRRFVQMWFAGNHSDVGGSYPEAESRLSDIALAWMIEEATALPNGLLVDWQPQPGQAIGIHRLQLFPAADGLQHCEVAGMRDVLDGLPWPLARLAKGRGWAVKVRSIHPEAPVHQSVYDRFDLPEARQCSGSGPYRPKALADHRDFERYYRVETQARDGHDSGKLA